MIDRLHIKEPHWYVFVLGVRPERQGEGLGRALLDPALARADRDRLPAYLETTKEQQPHVLRPFRLRGGAGGEHPGRRPARLDDAQAAGGLGGGRVEQQVRLEGQITAEQARRDPFIDLAVQVPPHTCASTSPTPTLSR